MKNRIIESVTFSFALSIAIISQYIRAPKFDSDIIWSYAVGKWISIHHAFPVVDSFSWTIKGMEWMTHEWMYSYLAYKMYSALGSLGLYVLTYIPVLATIYFLYLIAKRYDQFESYAYIIVFTIGVILLYLLALPFRAYIYALLFVTLLVYLLYFKAEKKYDLFLFVLLFILWANFQVSVFIGLVILAAELTRQFIIDPAKRMRAFWLGILSVISTFVNPYGYKLWSYFWFVTTNMSEHRHIQEWKAVDFNEPLILLLYLGIAASVLFLQFNDAKKSLRELKGKPELLNDNLFETRDTSKWSILAEWIRKNLTRETCLIIGFWSFYIYALYSVRMFVFSLIFWLIVVSYFVGKTQRFHFSRRTLRIYLLLFLVLALTGLSVAKFEIKDIFTYDNKISPIEEVAFLKENPIYSDHLFNDYIFGAYLINNDIPVFIDARCDSYIKFGILKKYLDISGLKEDPEPQLDSLGVNNLLIKDGIMNKYISISPKWKLVYGGPSAFIYTRIQP